MTTEVKTWYRVCCCTLLMLAGIGLVRYAYSPLAASMVHDHWLTPGQIGYVSTINFIGNLIGAISCAALARRLTGGWVSRIALMIGLCSVAACAFDFGFIWLSTWRFIAGLSAAFAMVLAPTMAVVGVKPSARGAIIGTVFVGAGVGIIGLSLLLPTFITHGPSGGWLFTAALVALCLILSWKGLSPRIGLGQPDARTEAKSTKPRYLRLLWLAYLLMAIAIVPHSIYLSAYVHEVLHEPLAMSTMVYAIYGLGVLIGGPLYNGLLQKYIGTHTTLALTAISATAAVAMVILSDSLWMVIGSACLLGAAQMGNTGCTTQRLLELVGPQAHPTWWGRYGLGYNIGMAAGAFGMGAMVHGGWGYIAGFWMAGVATILSLLIILITRDRPSTKEISAHA